VRSQPSTDHPDKGGKAQNEGDRPPVALARPSTNAVTTPRSDSRREAPPTVPDRLLAGNVRRHLETRWLGAEIHRLESVDSTNLRARALARQGAAHGTVVSAETQTSGRGRLGRGWVSPPHHNLYLSVVLRPALPPENLSQISLVAGVATVDALREWCEAWIKWPNDVLVGGRKVAGILAEMEANGTTPVVVLGIGVNVNSTADDFPEELRDKAGSLRMALGERVDRARIAGRLLTHLERRYDRLSAEGFSPVAAAWRERSHLIGRPIRVREPAGEIEGEVVDLDADGALRLRLASGEEHRVVSGDVTVVDGYA
jgi:BirA family biotin operon repressor/biotin-[acetyl-CoA-carboxylase] ligase